MREVAFFLIVSLACVGPVAAQSPNATITGLVVDPSGAAIAGAQVVVVNDSTGVQYSAKTNGEGIYVVPNLPPGPYRIQVSNSGFKTIIKPDIVIHVQDALAINFTLPIGSASVVVTVEGGAPMIDTQDATVSTVVDRQFAENLPMNGRSFQTLIQLTPGVVLTPVSTGLDSGQFSVNGQRASSNYWMVDGVSANVGASTFFGGNGLAGAVGTTSVFGGTNSLVSVDALQEFRIQTSTYAPEFGRTPGGQIAIVTRSGTSNFHGTAFDYFRNDVLDANNWFNTSVTPALPRAEERQNDFGGTFSGPLVRDRLFFFFSYEGLRLRLPQTALTTVPDLQSRQNASSALQPYLNAFPFDPNQPDLGNGIAQFDKSYSNPATLDAYSLRVDHRLSHKLALFGRYNYSPSEIGQRGFGFTALSSTSRSRITTQTTTLGSTWAISAEMTNDLRFNYSRSNASTQLVLDRFGGAVPLTSLPFPPPYTSESGNLSFYVLSLSNPSLQVGAEIHNLQRQMNLVDNFSIQKGPHNLKFGVDYRRLSPGYAPFLYSQNVYFLDVQSAENGALFAYFNQSNAGATLLLHNLGAFAQDTWRVSPRLTLTYGLRWDVDFAPTSSNGPDIPAVVGFNLTDLSQLALAPAGTRPFATSYAGVAPRFGAAYQLSQNQERETVLRAGFGIFYDLATSEVANLINNSGYPFHAQGGVVFGGTFPLDSMAAAPPRIEPPSAANNGTLAAFNPHLNLPYTFEWNAALEQGLGRQQSLAASYVGATGRRLVQTAIINAPNTNIATADLITNAGTSDYNSFQLHFRRRLLHGLQALASYTWSHSIDTSSAGSYGNAANRFVPAENVNLNRASSDFDIRNAFSAGLTYDIPAAQSRSFANLILRDWSLENVIQAWSAPPINVFNSRYGFGLLSASTSIRPDVVPGVPLYLYGPQYPGGKAINNTPGAVSGRCPNGSQSMGPFCPPPTDSNRKPLRQGDLGRNALRGFGATQWDFAVHREFRVIEPLRLQFRAEMFNVLNHPNFGQPDGNLSDPTFGRATAMLAQYLGGNNLGAGGFSSLYQVGGPRSIQFALKLMF